MRLPALAFALFLTPSIALACPGKTQTADTTTAATKTAAADATACAKKASLVGSACSYSTGMMASRVLEQGKSFNYVGTLAPTKDTLASQVAAPYLAGPEGVRVIANEVIENVTSTDDRMNFSGKMLEVDGVKYFLVTEFEKVAA